MIKNMKKICTLISLVLIVVFLTGSKVNAEKEELLINNVSDATEAYEQLLHYDGHTILKEYIYLESKGINNLIPYACALRDKYTEFSSDELIYLIKDEKSLSEVESVLVEMLRIQNYDFSKLIYLQDEKDVATNTKQQLLLSDSIPDDILVYYIENAEDFRARSAMQQLSFKDKEKALSVAVEMLHKTDVGYYQLSAINIAIAEYYRYNYEKDTFKDYIIDSLLKIYEKLDDQQMRFWVMDSLGWIKDYSLFRAMVDNESFDLFDRYVYYSLSEKALDYFCSKYGDYPDYEEYNSKYVLLMSDEIMEHSLCEYWNIETKSNYSLSSYSGYAVYRNQAFGSDNYDHAAIMYRYKIMGGANYANYPTATDVIHARGYTYSLQKSSWSVFLNGKTFICACKPKNCTMSSANTFNFVAKAIALEGTSYTVLTQAYYNITGDNTKVEPSQITDMRCDGLVEYVYEYYGYRVGGGDNDWDITKNNYANYAAHCGTLITPTTQYTSLLTQVTTSQSDLY